MTDIQDRPGDAADVRDDSGVPVDKVVFGVAAAIAVAFVAAGATWPTTSRRTPPRP